MKHHLDNFEGAFPLLLIGSVLVVYAGILASQEIGSHSSHLPLWGLLGGVGAVIVGAGIYSTTLEPEPVPAPSGSGPWLAAPKAEGEARTVTPRLGERKGPATSTDPIWWEGPATRSTPATAPPPPEAGLRRTASTVRNPVLPSTGRAPFAVTSRHVPRPTARYTFKELSDELSELESLVYGSPGRPAAQRPPPSRPPTASTCMDCDRPLTPAAAASPCRNCGRGLCARCAASSRSEDGEVRCIDCRARAT